MTIERALIGTTDAGSATYIEDVFSTYLYTGTGASQTITNGIALSTKGGLVWLKGRSGATDHGLYDTIRGATYDLGSNLTSAQTTQSTGLTAFGTTGYTIGALAKLNTSAATYASWTFRNQDKFFDIVSYTGNGSNRTIAHNLGSTPGMIVVKRTNATGNWKVYHRSLTSAAYYIHLNDNVAQASDTTVWNSTAPTSSVFSVGTHADVNASGGSYIAYLFAHNAGGFGADGTQNVISCGSFNASNSVNITLGYEPQYILMRYQTDGWYLFDKTRGITSNSYKYFLADTASAEGSGAAGLVYPTTTGFTYNGTNFGITSGTWFYVAIRKNMK